MRFDNSQVMQAEYEILDQKFQNFVVKQEQTLRVSIYLLLNLSEDIKVIVSYCTCNKLYVQKFFQGPIF
jgi:hypothetical protein